MIRLVHGLPGRSRYKLARLRDRHLDLRYVRSYLEAVPGVRGVRVNPGALSLVIEHETSKAVRAAVAEAVSALAKADLPRTARADQGGAPPDGSRLLAGAALILALPLLPRPLRAVLTAINIAGNLKTGLTTLVTRGMKVEVLDSIAVGLSAVRGEYVTANITQLLLNFSDYVQSTTQRASDDLILRLLQPDAEEVWVETEDGAVVAQPFSSVVPGTKVVVGAGELIPIDGVVASGSAYVNQSTVTGESLPIPREAGDAVLSGSVVEEGRLTIIAERVGGSTTTARIARFIQQALAEEADTQSKASLLADRRVYITLASGAAIFALTRDIRRVEAVFLVDFSCAVKLGTSVAVKSAMFKAARHGALVKGGRALERLAEVDTVVFDKTGTLTHNELEVTDIVCLGPLCTSQDDLLAMVASVAEHSRHPVSAAVVDIAKRRNLAHMGHEEVDFFVGHGLATAVGDHTLRIGSRHYLEEHEGIDFTPYEDILTGLTAQGETLLYVGSDGRPHGVIGLRDRLRPDAAQVLAQLRAGGITRLVMITGDHRDKAQALGTTLGLDAVHGQIAPEEKAEIIKALQAEGRKVAFVGDGVNDGPALMVADVGIAMPRGADVARATADVVLLEDDLRGVAETRLLATRTIDLIDRNFTVAAGINTAVMFGAVAGWLSPVATALLHNGTTIGVLANAFLGGDFSRQGITAALADLRKAALAPPRDEGERPL
ncbi:heavy metal translocating P-type ATPase [Rhodospirillum rubrum]|uniref:heavy metal translocating P-type ATPase n=1 Tax=Rhodospirillum rubrum TaxID=1085 RepID=UPI00190521E6|nr:heavy metal translocating P-type ATPase [Rhodospirillum rubrum]MBK1663900.1 heavy metal translocating P-type ATPase [Rhodospirillum rubrum]MBK1676739.1 heavy metal translocating P-type ATPase [Rhodospirillum rubrum]